MIPNGTCINGKGLTPDIEVENVSLDGISTKDVKETLKVDCVNTRIKSKAERERKSPGYHL